jgi:hypothetical protein
MPKKGTPKKTKKDVPKSPPEIDVNLTPPQMAEDGGEAFTIPQSAVAPSTESPTYEEEDEEEIDDSMSQHLGSEEDNFSVISMGVPSSLSFEELKKTSMTSSIDFFCEIASTLDDTDDNREVLIAICRISAFAKDRKLSARDIGRILMIPPKRVSQTETTLTSDQQSMLADCKSKFPKLTKEAVNEFFTGPNGEKFLGPNKNWSVNCQRSLEALLEKHVTFTGIQVHEILHLNPHAIMLNQGIAVFDCASSSGGYSSASTQFKSGYRSTKLSPNAEAANTESRVCDTSNVGGLTVTNHRPLSITKLNSKNHQWGYFFDKQKLNENDWDAFSVLAGFTSNAVWDTGTSALSKDAIFVARKIQMVQEFLFDVVGTITDILIDNNDERSAEFSIFKNKVMSPNGSAINEKNLSRLPSTLIAILERREMDLDRGTYALLLLRERLQSAANTMGLNEVRKIFMCKYQYQGGFAFGQQIQNLFLDAEESASMPGYVQHPATTRQMAIWTLVAGLNTSCYSRNSKFSSGDKQAVLKLNELYNSGLLRSWNHVNKFMGEQTALGRLLPSSTPLGTVLAASTVVDSSASVDDNSDSGGGSGSGTKKGSSKKRFVGPDTLGFYHNAAVEFKKMVAANGCDPRDILERIHLTSPQFPHGCSLRLIRDGKSFAAIPASIAGIAELQKLHGILLRAVAPHIGGQANKKFNPLVAQAVIIQSGTNGSARNGGAHGAAQVDLHVQRALTDLAKQQAAAKVAVAQQAAKEEKAAKRAKDLEAREQARQEQTQAFMAMLAAASEERLEQRLGGKLEEVVERNLKKVTQEWRQPDGWSTVGRGGK